LYVSACYAKQGFKNKYGQNSSFSKFISLIKYKSMIKRISYVILCILLLSFNTADRSEYTVPRAAWAVCADDLDLDGDCDIVVGHNYDWQTLWSGISISLNTGAGDLILFDSVYLYAGQTDTKIDNLDENPMKEIIGKYFDTENETEYIAIINNFDLTDISYFSLNTNEGVGYVETGDINGDSVIDIVFASTNGQFWGVIYNDGTGNFSDPEHYYVEGYWPLDIDCGDLNSDGRDDIVVCGIKTEVYFSYPGSFQLLTLETEDLNNEVAIVDFDLDGDNDIIAFFDAYLVNYTTLFFYKNIGNNTFTELERFDFQPNCGDFFVIDFNNDTLPDILFCSGDYTGYYIFYNEGGFTLSQPQFVAVPDYDEGWRHFYCADIDGNGYNDIITTRCMYAHLPANLDIRFNDGNGNFVEDPVVGSNEITLEHVVTISCFPNPFQFKTVLEYNISEPAHVELTIYNLQGELIAILISEKMERGKYSIAWAGNDQNNRPFKPGIYFANLKSNGKIQSILKIIKV
jgi:hypothetical protein